MTAEIVIMNKEAVAIAADSAVSLMMGPSDKPQKIFTSANKIHYLSGAHSVCIMIYNNSAFMGIPWETIITTYRNHLGGARFNTLKEYVEHFIDFLAKDEELIPESLEQTYFVSTLYNYFLFVRGLIQQMVNQKIHTQGGLTQEEVQKLVSEVIEDVHKRLTKAPFLPQVKKAQVQELTEAFEGPIEEGMSKVFEQIPLNDEEKKKLQEIVILFYVKDLGPANPLQRIVSGVVVTGFGEKDIFPSLVSLSVEGRVQKILKFTTDEHQQITFENGALIVPFAQREMVDIFMSGMNPELGEAMLKTISTTFHSYTNALVDGIPKLSEKERKEVLGEFMPKVDAIVNQLSNEMSNYRASNFMPIVNVVASQPKHELASMAESLVKLTSLKRRVSLQAETVGGPVDVAVISKGDGFVWVKKKQYYQPELNPQTRTDQEVAHGQKEE